MIKNNEITAEDFGLREDENKPEESYIFPTFDIVSNPTVRISDIHRRRFNIIDRAQSVRQEIESPEDIAIFEALRNSDGYYSIGAVFSEPIRRNLNYQGIARSIFPVEILQTGAEPMFTRHENIEDTYRREVLAEWSVDNNE